MYLALSAPRLLSIVPRTPAELPAPALALLAPAAAPPPPPAELAVSPGAGCTSAAAALPTAAPTPGHQPGRRADSSGQVEAGVGEADRQVQGGAEGGDVVEVVLQVDPRRLQDIDPEVITRPGQLLGTVAILQVDEAEVTPGASFQEDLGADSLDVVELVMQFEEAFDLEIPDEDAEKIKTVKDAIDYIEKNAKGK